MLQFSEVRQKMDTIRNKWSRGSVSKKQAAAELRKWIKERQKEDLQESMALFWNGWLS